MFHLHREWINLLKVCCPGKESSLTCNFVAGMKNPQCSSEVSYCKYVYSSLKYEVQSKSFEKVVSIFTPNSCITDL